MAVKENQGLQIALIIFVVITVILSVSTFMFFKYYEDAVLVQAEAESRAEKAEGELGGADYMRQFAAATEGAVAARFESLACCEEANSSF